MSTTTTAVNQNKTKLAISAFVDSTMENMGLELHGQVVMPGGWHKEEMWIREISGIPRAVSGLDEFCPEILSIRDEAVKAAKIAAIRKEAAEIEQLIFGVSPDPSTKNKDFWAALNIRSHNTKFFQNDRFTLQLSNSSRLLNIEDPFDRIIYNSIKAGGYHEVAPSLDEAKKNPTRYKFYLDQLELTAASNSELRKVKNEAKTILTGLLQNPDKMVLIARNWDPQPCDYKKSTPTDTVYTNLDMAIDGEKWQKNKKKAAQDFIDISKKTTEELIIRSVISVATQLKLIAAKKDGFIWYMKDGINLGRTIEEVYQMLQNAVHQDIFRALQDECDNSLNN